MFEPSEFLTAMGLVLSSAYFSASEVALFSLSRFQLRSLKDEFPSVHKRVRKLLSDPSGLLITVLVLNEVINVALSSMITSRVAQAGFKIGNLPNWAVDTIIGIAITFPIVLILCDATPKVIAARTNRLFTFFASGLMPIAYWLLGPLRKVIQLIVKQTVDRLSPKQITSVNAAGLETEPHEGLEHSKKLRESEFILMMEEGLREGSVQESEVKLVRSVFDLDDLQVADIFTPTWKVFTLPENSLIKSAINSIRNNRYSRIPIMREGRKEIVGIMYVKDLLRARINPELTLLPLSAIMRRPLFVPPNLSLSALFRKFKQHRVHLAVVKNSAGIALGIVTMSDLLDSFLEEIDE